MLLVPVDPFRALIAHCLGSSSRLPLDARASHAPESDVKDAKRDFEDDIALPSDLLELIVQHLPRSDHAAARLTCRDMEKLIAPMLRTLFIKDWEISIITVSFVNAIDVRSAAKNPAHVLPDSSAQPRQPLVLKRIYCIGVQDLSWRCISIQTTLLVDRVAPCSASSCLMLPEQVCAAAQQHCCACTRYSSLQTGINILNIGLSLRFSRDYRQFGVCNSQSTVRYRCWVSAKLHRSPRPWQQCMLLLVESPAVSTLLSAHSLSV